jgi:MFS family permease
MYLTAPILFATFQKYPTLRRPFTVIGLLTMCTSLALSSFSKTVTHLILTQGILYAIGGGMAYAPTILFVNEWFIKRKGLAFGIVRKIEANIVCCILSSSFHGSLYFD